MTDPRQDLAPRRYAELGERVKQVDDSLRDSSGFTTTAISPQRHWLTVKAGRSSTWSTRAETRPPQRVHSTVLSMLPPSALEQGPTRGGKPALERRFAPG
jgi:hypothetical protein